MKYAPPGRRGGMRRWASSSGAAVARKLVVHMGAPGVGSASAGEAFGGGARCACGRAIKSTSGQRPQNTRCAVRLSATTRARIMLRSHMLPGCCVGEPATMRSLACGTQWQCPRPILAHKNRTSAALPATPHAAHRQQALRTVLGTCILSPGGRSGPETSRAFVGVLPFGRF